MANLRLNYNYAIIDENGLCYQVASTQREFNRADFIAIETYSNQYIGKYYYDNQWWERQWNEYETITHTNEETGETWTETVPVESAGYVDVPWSLGE